MTQRLNAAQPIVRDDGTMDQVFRQFMLSVSLQIPIRGTGSPETVVNAVQDQVYLDTTGGAGANWYVKMFDDIGGDTTQGWQLT